MSGRRAPRTRDEIEESKLPPVPVRPPRVRQPPPRPLVPGEPLAVNHTSGAWLPCTYIGPVRVGEIEVEVTRPSVDPEQPNRLRLVLGEGYGDDAGCYRFAADVALYTGEPEPPADDLEGET